MPSCRTNLIFSFAFILVGGTSAALPWLPLPAMADETEAARKDALFSRWIAPPAVSSPEPGMEADSAADLEEQLMAAERQGAVANDQVFDEVDLADRFLPDVEAEGKSEPSLQAALPESESERPVQVPVEEPSWPAEPRVVLHASPRGTTLAERFIGKLAARPDISLENRRVDIDVSTSHLRYYDRRDADKAASLAVTLGTAAAPLPVRDFTHYRPRPHRGLIEVWVTGTGADENALPSTIELTSSEASE